MSENSRGDVLRVAKELGWRDAGVNKKGYLKLCCPCGEHMKWLHKTPSDPNYYVNAIADIRRKPCAGGNSPDSG